MFRSTKWAMLLGCLALSFVTLFLSVGYAAVSTQLTVSGTANWDGPSMVYITDVHVVGKSNATGNCSVTKTGFVMFEHADYTLNQQWSQYSPGGSVTIEVTVRNNSGIDQYYAAHTSDPALPAKCVVSYPADQAFAPGSVVKNGEYRTFRLTIQNTDPYSTVRLNGMESTLVFSPNFDSNVTQNATKSLAEIFGNVLAGTGPAGNGAGITYKGQHVPADRIMQVISEQMQSVDTGGYMGNVGNATQDQKDLISAIFGDNMVMQIGNTYYTVSVLIKNQQIDNSGENDMVMYITADQLTRGSGGWDNGQYRNLNIVPVYGIVFINNGARGYSYCNHLFAGEAPVCNFAGDFGEGNTGNFNTNLWNSTEYPNVTDNSGGEITETYISKNGELDEAYQRYVRGY